MTKKGKHTILFICLGNICRSPAAEGIMKSLVEKAGFQDEFEIDSAGIGGWHIGQLPDSRMRKNAAPSMATISTAMPASFRSQTSPVSKPSW